MMIYINNKTGQRYRLQAVGTDCTNVRDGTPVAVYCPEGDEFTVFVRDLSEFQVKFRPDETKSAN